MAIGLRHRHRHYRRSLWPLASASKDRQAARHSRGACCQGAFECVSSVPAPEQRAAPPHTTCICTAGDGVGRQLHDMPLLVVARVVSERAATWLFEALSLDFEPIHGSRTGWCSAPSTQRVLLVPLLGSRPHRHQFLLPGYQKMRHSVWLCKPRHHSHRHPSNLTSALVKSPAGCYSSRGKRKQERLATERSSRRPRTLGVRAVVGTSRSGHRSCQHGPARCCQLAAQAPGMA